jgi:hypothetical protein
MENAMPNRTYQVILIDERPQLADAFSDAVAFANGPEAAIRGLEINDVSLHEGGVSSIRRWSAV